MSSIKSTQIDGDVSVSRNAAVGGDVTVQGKTHLKGNVKIEGWIEAKNIKAANKGLFTTIEKLPRKCRTSARARPSPAECYRAGF